MVVRSSRANISDEMREGRHTTIPMRCNDASLLVRFSPSGMLREFAALRRFP